MKIPKQLQASLPSRVIIGVFHCVISFFDLVFLFYLVYHLLKRRKNLRQIDSFILVQSIVSIFLVIHGFISLASYINQGYITSNNIFCSFEKFSYNAITSTITLLLVSITYERWRAVYKPLEFHRTMKSIILQIIIIAIISMIISIPVAIVNEIQIFSINDGIYDCFPNRFDPKINLTILIVLIIFNYGLPITVMIVIYPLITNKINSNLKKCGTNFWNSGKINLVNVHHNDDDSDDANKDTLKPPPSNGPSQDSLIDMSRPRSANFKMIIEGKLTKIAIANLLFIIIFLLPSPIIIAINTWLVKMRATVHQAFLSLQYAYPIAISLLYIASDERLYSNFKTIFFRE